MIIVNQESTQQAIRHLADFIEPYVIKQLQKKYHAFFVYRCSEYQTFEHYCKKELIKCQLSNELYTTLSEFWHTIDVIRCIPKEQIKYEASKEFFSHLYQLQITQKIMIDFECYEVKAQMSEHKPILSCKSYALLQKLKSYNKKLNIIHIKGNGLLKLHITETNFSPEKFEIKTHYGRRKAVKSLFIQQ